MLVNGHDELDLSGNIPPSHPVHHERVPGMKIPLNAVQPTAPRFQEGTKTTPTSTRARNRPRHPRPHLTYCRNLDDQTRRPLLQPPRLKRKKGSALHLSGGSGGVRNANRGMWGILSRSFENADQATRTTRVRKSERVRRDLYLESFWGSRWQVTGCSETDRRTRIGVVSTIHRTRVTSLREGGVFPEISPRRVVRGSSPRFGN